MVWQRGPSPGGRFRRLDAISGFTIRISADQDDLGARREPRAAQRKGRVSLWSSRW